MIGGRNEILYTVGLFALRFVPIFFLGIIVGGDFFVKIDHFDNWKGYVDYRWMD